MVGKKYALGVAFIVAGAGVALVASRIIYGESIGILKDGIFGGSGIISLVGFVFIIQSFMPEE
ncbi:MAG TPA: hypothetical protein VFX17_01035 [Patescibacteria group bacterium]|nr:hypothetical protein [Patescibacteria group bacterium]